MRRGFIRSSLSLAVASLLTTSVAAHAADLAPVWKATPPASNWTGFYVGGNAGLSAGGFSQTWTDFGVPYAWDHAISGGFSGGGQIGFNYQFPTSNLVIGFETDFQDSTLKGTYADYGASTLQFGSQIDWWGTARARFGYAFGTLLPFVTGGLAYGHLTNSYYASPAQQPPGYSETWSTIRTGWTVGGGFELRLDPQPDLEDGISLRRSRFLELAGSSGCRAFPRRNIPNRDNALPNGSRRSELEVLTSICDRLMA
jgi:outer membrane immunogenic protein